MYTVCFTFGLSYANALILVLLDGVVFIILTLTGVRKMLFDAIPQCVRMAISAGIGLFIAFWDYRMRELLFLQALPVST